MERKSRTTTIILAMLFLLLVSVPSLAVRKLTTKQMRNNTIRINALELDEIDITKVKGIGKATFEKIKDKIEV